VSRSTLSTTSHSRRIQTGHSIHQHHSYLLPRKNGEDIFKKHTTTTTTALQNNVCHGLQSTMIDRAEKQLELNDTVCWILFFSFLCTEKGFLVSQLDVIQKQK